MKYRFLTAIMAVLCAISNLVAQPTATPAATTPPKPAVDHSYKPLTLKLTDDGSKYVRFIMWHQFWATATQNNPDTKDIQGHLIDGMLPMAHGVLTWLFVAHVLSCTHRYLPAHSSSHTGVSTIRVLSEELLLLPDLIQG